MRKLAILASGSGTNAEKIIEYFASSEEAKVEIVLSNNAEAQVLERAHRLGVDSFVFDRQMFRSGEVLEELERRSIDFIILAGFLWLVPLEITRRYANRIVNIHPSLLPKYGGKGMYGDNVHRAVVEAGESVTGITIHKLNEEYDGGDIIAQFEVALSPDDGVEQVADKVHALEYEHYPRVIEEYIRSMESDK